MDLERFFRDLAYASSSDQPDRALAEIASIHGDHARRLMAQRQGLVEKFGAAGAQKFSEDMATMAASAAIAPSRDVDPQSAYFGYLAASKNPQRFAWWLEKLETPYVTGIRRAAAKTADGFGTCASRVPIRVLADYHLGEPPTEMLDITDEMVSAAAGGLVPAASVDPFGVGVHVSGSDCPVSRARAFEGLEISCRTATELTGCAHFRGIGCDGHVRCAAQRVAQITQPGNPMAPSPKPGDLLDLSNRDGTKTKVKITRIDPDMKPVIEPTLG